jgi:hypothetical protein
MIYYLGARFSKETNSKLTEYRLLNNLSQLEMPSLGFHCTIIHSKTPFKYLLQPFKDARMAFIGGIHLLGNSIVLSIAGSWAQIQHNTCLSYGATSEYYPYNPHITVAEEAIKIPNIVNSQPFKVEITELFYMEW